MAAAPRKQREGLQSRLALVPMPWAAGLGDQSLARIRPRFEGRPTGTRTVEMTVSVARHGCPNRIVE